MQDAEVDRIGEGSGLGTDNNVFKPESDDEDDYDYEEEEEEEQNQAVEEKVEKLVLLITEAPEIQPEETTKNQEFYDYIEQNYRQLKYFGTSAPARRHILEILIFLGRKCPEMIKFPTPCSREQFRAP